MKDFSDNGMAGMQGGYVIVLPEEIRRRYPDSSEFAAVLATLLEESDVTVYEDPDALVEDWQAWKRHLKGTP